MKLAARLAVLVLAAARLAPIEESQAFAPNDVEADTTTQWTICKLDPCLGEHCCCWSTLYLDPHPDYPNPEIANRERKCTRGGLPADYVLLKEPGYVGSNGQEKALMANQNPDYAGRDLCCVVSIHDVTDIASAHTMQEEVPTTTTTEFPVLENPDPMEETEAAPAEEGPPPEGPPPDDSANVELHSGAFHGLNHTNKSNHSNHSNHSNGSDLDEWRHWVESSLAHARRESQYVDDGAAPSEFEELEKESDGGFDFRDLPRLQNEAASVMAARGHLRAWR